MKILEVKNLKISFRTNSGRVQAVRGIDFTVNEGETLAIVGESGSGKSVTARAILGILAGNAIVDSGEILFDGQDLLKIAEDDFHRIRGEKISMIFQDPLSSLNPIIKIGKQLTEAMLLKNKSVRRKSKKEHTNLLKLISETFEKSGIVCAKTDDGKLNFDDITALSNAVEFSRRENLVKKEAALERLKLALHILEDDTELKKRSIDGFFRSVTNTINELKTFLTTGKDSIVYTFESSVKSQLSRLYGAKKHNSAEIKKYGKAKKKYYNRIEFGMTVNYTVQEPSLIDLSEVRKNLTLIVTRLGESLKADIANESGVDYTEKATDIIGLLKELEEASGNIVTKSIAKERAIKIMGEVGIPSPEIRYNQYPFEFSGGMRQRIVIATALVANPKLLICDEPTTALDVTIQAQILELINELKATRNISVIFITHDLGVVAQMADRVAVMYAGKIVESGTAEDIFYEPRHPYTWALLSSMPDTDTKGDLEAIPGTPPNMIYPPKGDAFAPRNKYALAIDFEQMPPLISVSDTHSVASWLVHPDAPKVDPPLVVSERIARMMALQNPDNANINDGNGGENE